MGSSKETGIEGKSARANDRDSMTKMGINQMSLTSDSDEKILKDIRSLNDRVGEQGKSHTSNYH